MTNEPASPVCDAAKADDVYMGYAGRDEVVAGLNELLEAERAGARVAAATAKTAPNEAYCALMLSVRNDEARWCAMLSRQIRKIGGMPSPACGDFHGKAMAIADPVSRLEFLNRGQDWVVRKLEALMPRVRDDALHGELRAMLESHRLNIGRADLLVQEQRGHRIVGGRPEIKGEV